WFCVFIGLIRKSLTDHRCHMLEEHQMVNHIFFGLWAWHCERKRSRKFLHQSTQSLPAVRLREDMIDRREVHGQHHLRFGIECSRVVAPVEERALLLERRLHGRHRLVLNLLHRLASAARLDVGGKRVRQLIRQQALKERTSASEIVRRLVSDYLKQAKKGGKPE